MNGVEAVIKFNGGNSDARKKIMYEYMDELVMHGLNVREFADVLCYKSAADAFERTRIKLIENGWNPNDIKNYANEYERVKRFNEITKDVQRLIVETEADMKEQDRKIEELLLMGYTPNEVSKELNVSMYYANKVRKEIEHKLVPPDDLCPATIYLDNSWVEWFTEEWNKIRAVAMFLKRKRM